MLRKIRLTFAMICFVLITLLFLDFTGTLHGWFGWLAKIQFLPAVLALNVGVILFLALNPQLHSRSATYIKRNGLLIRKITIKSSRPFQCAYHPLTP